MSAFLCNSYPPPSCISQPDAEQIRQLKAAAQKGLGGARAQREAALARAGTPEQMIMVRRGLLDVTASKDMAHVNVVRALKELVQAYAKPPVVASAKMNKQEAQPQEAPKPALKSALKSKQPPPLPNAGVEDVVFELVEVVHSSLDEASRSSTSPSASSFSASSVHPSVIRSLSAIMLALCSLNSGDAASKRTRGSLIQAGIIDTALGVYDIASEAIKAQERMASQQRQQQEKQQREEEGDGSAARSDESKGITLDKCKEKAAVAIARLLIHVGT